MIKYLLFFLLLLQTGLYAKSAFLKMCEHPTPSQLMTLNAFAGPASTTPLSKERCKELNEATLEGGGIDLCHKNLTDLTPLRYFTHIEHIDITDNNITDLSPLAGLKHLQELEIAWNPISDISPIKNLKLKKLTIASNRHRPGYRWGSYGSAIGVKVNLSSISNMSSLEALWINGDNEKVPDLSKLTHLTFLYLAGLDMPDLCSFKNAKKLKTLWLSYDENLTSLKCVENFKNLTELKLFDLAITDLSPLTTLQKLKELKLEKMPVSDIRPLAKLKSLEDLTFFKTKIKYLSPLKESKSLKYITNENKYKLFSGYALSGGLQAWWQTVGDRSLAHCSPIDMTEIREGISCFKKDGTLKPWWKRMLRQ
jgi:hypothetical protein